LLNGDWKIILNRFDTVISEQIFALSNVLVWLPDSGAASYQEGKAGKLQKGSEKCYPKINGSFFK